MTVAFLTLHAKGAILPWVLLYVGPDLFMPLASAFAAVAGVVLMFWNRLIRIIVKIRMAVTRRPE